MIDHEGTPNDRQPDRNNLVSYGWLGRDTDGPVKVERTAENDHFFLNDERLVYHGSALIVSLLELHQAVEKIVSETNETASQKRRLAFFDKRGDFYGPVLLCGLYPNVNINGNSRVKHTAVFEPLDNQSEAFAIPIDDIYCMSLAKPATAGVIQTIEKNTND